MLKVDGAAEPVWGTVIERSMVRGHPCLVYRDRPGSVADFLLDARRFGHRDYLVQGDRRISYAEHEQAVSRLAARLRDAGIRPGDRVLLLGGNRVEWVVTFYASLVIGAVVVPGNAWWSPGEVAHAVTTTQPSVIVVDGRRAGLIPGDVTGVVADFDDLGFALDGATPDVELDVTASGEDEPAVILFTSGTTGLPKGVTLSHRAVIANPHNLLALTRRFPGDVPLDSAPAVSLLTLPLFHMGGIQAILVTLLTGGTLLFLEGRFDAGAVLRLIESEGVTRWGCVPTMVARVLDHPDLARCDTSTLKSITMGAAPVLPELVARTRAAFPRARHGVGTAYGLSESGGVLTTGIGDDYAARPHSVGKPLPVVEVRIDQPDDHGLGEILARSPTNMSGYWGVSDDDTIDEDGWLHTGDIGRLDDDGHLYVLDRAKDVIIRGGENIACSHVENQILRHPSVGQVAVLGLSHPDLGEEVAAVVVPRGECAPSVEELSAYAATVLARFQVPTTWWIRDEPLPLSSAGKVLKRQLRETWPERRPDPVHESSGVR
jgi:long-chain acyl-CoA synthetase